MISDVLDAFVGRYGVTCMLFLWMLLMFNVKDCVCVSDVVDAV